MIVVWLLTWRRAICTTTVPPRRNSNTQRLTILVSLPTHVPVCVYVPTRPHHGDFSALRSLGRRLFGRLLADSLFSLPPSAFHLYYNGSTLSLFLFDASVRAVCVLSLSSARLHPQQQHHSFTAVSLIENIGPN